MRCYLSYIIIVLLALPAAGQSNVVTASATGFPMPCASRKLDPIWSMNCESTAHPPRSENCSASMKHAPCAIHPVRRDSANAQRKGL